MEKKVWVNLTSLFYIVYRLKIQVIVWDEWNKNKNAAHLRNLSTLSGPRFPGHNHSLVILEGVEDVVSILSDRESVPLYLKALRLIWIPDKSRHGVVRGLLFRWETIVFWKVNNRTLLSLQLLGFRFNESLPGFKNFTCEVIICVFASQKIRVKLILDEVCMPARGFFTVCETETTIWIRNLSDLAFFSRVERLFGWKKIWKISKQSRARMRKV